MSVRFKRRADDTSATDVHYEHDRLDAVQGDTVAMTLMAADVLETTRSVKYRRPRGAYCLRGDCGSCLVRIDGRPNQRACLTAVTPHMQIDPQNRLMENGPDLSGIVDRVLKGGMDHHHFMVRPKIANKIMQGVARGLTGLGVLPERVPDGDSTHHQHTPDVLIIGGGPAGHGVFDVIGRAKGHSVLWVDRRPVAAGETRSELRSDTGVYGVYPQEGVLAAMRRSGRNAPELHTIVPRHVVYATGATEPTMDLANNDLPGVVSARGLLEQLHRGRATLDCPAVVIGRGPLATSAAASLGCDCIDPSDVVELLGGSRVEGVQTKDGKVAAELVALAPDPAPAYELARQGGAQVRYDGRGFAVVRDADGRCGSTGPFTAWACGDIVGYDVQSHDDDPQPTTGESDPSFFGRAHDAAARGDGQRVGQAILAALANPVSPPTERS